MRGPMIRILIASMIFASAARVDAAETFKMRQLAPVYVDGKGQGILQPEGVACRGNSLVVADTGHGRLLRYTISGEAWAPSGEIVLPQLTSPIRLEMNSKGEILALDGSSRKIARLASSGEFLGYLAPAAGGGAFVPRALKVDREDNVYLLDVASARVFVVDPAGKTIREIAFPKGYGFLSDLAVDAGGDVYLLDSVGKRVFKAAKGQATAAAIGEGLKDEAYFPVSIALNRQGALFLVDQHGGGVVILGRDGTFRGRRLSMGRKDGFLKDPAQICITENGTAFIADRGNNRVDAFQIVE